MSEQKRDRWLGFVSAEVALDPSISAAAKSIYLVLAVYADRDGTCYPSGTTLATASGCSRSTVTRGLAELEAAGVIRRDDRYVDGRQTSNLFTLLDIKAARDQR